MPWPVEPYADPLDWPICMVEILQASVIEDAFPVEDRHSLADILDVVRIVGGDDDNIPSIHTRRNENGANGQNLKKRLGGKLGD